MLDRYASRAGWRRVVLLGLTVLTTIVGGLLMAEILEPEGISAVEIAILVAFVPGFAMIASPRYWPQPMHTRCGIFGAPQLGQA